MEVFYIIGAILFLLIIVYICFYKKINLFVVAITGKKRIQKKLYKECKIHDFLILNDIWLPIGDNKYKYVDTIIFGNKYIYITKEVKQAGEVKIELDDVKWRVIYHNSLTLIENPFLYNKRVINHLLNVVEGLEAKDLKNLVVLAKTCSFKAINSSNNEFVVSENDAIKTIIEIEKNSDDDVFDPFEVERYCKAFYEHGLEAEKVIKKRK